MELEWRTKLAVLWFIQAVNYAAYVLILIVEGGALGTAAAGESGMLLAVFFLIPCALAWSAFALAPTVSRWPHMVFGALFAAIKLYASVQALTSETGSRAVLVNEAWAFVAAALLVWCAWKYPRPAR